MSAPPEQPRSIGSAAARVFLAGSAAAIAAFGTNIVTAHFLEPDGRGQYALAVLVATLVVTVAGLSLASANAYHVARRSHPNRDVLGTSVVLSALIGFVALGAALALVALTEPGFLAGVSRRDVAIALLAIPATLLTVNLQAMLLSLDQVRAFNLSVVAQTGVPFLLVTLALVTVERNVSAAVAATTVASFLVAAVTVAMCGHAAGGFHWRPTRAYARDALGFALRAHFGNVLMFLGYRLDALLINVFLNPAAVGVYAVAVATVERLWGFSFAASSVLFRRVAAESGERRERTPMILRGVLGVTLLAAAPLYLLSDLVTRVLYGTAFDTAAEPMRALLPGIVAMAGARVVCSDIAGRGRPLVTSALAAVSVACNLGLNLYFVPRWGIVGAAWASTASYSLLFVTALLVYSRMARTPLFSIFVPTRQELGAWKSLLSRS